jgi:hypothetical protein
LGLRPLELDTVGYHGGSGVRKARFWHAITRLARCLGGDTAESHPHGLTEPRDGKSARRWAANATILITLTEFRELSKFLNRVKLFLTANGKLPMLAGNRRIRPPK